MSVKDLESLIFENTFVKSFPGDSGPADVSRITSKVLFSKVIPIKVSKPEMLIWSESAGLLLDLEMNQENQQNLAEVFSGNRILPGMDPIATRYGGHQFGHWAGQLGDGRAMSLGEILNSENRRWEIQLKGAGQTPYSRGADGKAVLRSSLREFLCSEAMYYLGVPTTRALCCVTTGDLVERDMFYDGNPELEPGAITTRLSPSFLRFGHFQILAAAGEVDLLRNLVEYTIQHHFPEHHAQNDAGIATWLGDVCVRTAELMVEWLRVGFVHGVMNTDNMSILGLTIDYGPYGWLDNYDPDWTPNTTDAERRRYRFGAQPEIAMWNLTRLAEALIPLVTEKSELETALGKYAETFNQKYPKMMAKKLGLESAPSAEVLELIEDLDTLLRMEEVDVTLFYRKLGGTTIDQATIPLLEACYSSAVKPEFINELQSWLSKYFKTLEKNGISDLERKQKMDKINPVFILRNYLVQQVLEDLQAGKQESLKELLLALKTPYSLNEKTEKYFAKRPEWARKKPGCSALSCSS